MTRFDHFPFRYNYFEAIRSLPADDRLEVYEAIIFYGLTGKTPSLNGVQNGFFTAIKPQIDADRRRTDTLAAKSHAKVGA